MESSNKNIYTKSRLIKELAFRAGIKQTASKQLLEVLAEIAYRETLKGPFVIPGICKLELCDRKARKLRNPRTGGQLIMPPHKALRITASRRAKDAVAPRVSAVPAESYVPPKAEVEAPLEKKPAVSESVPPITEKPLNDSVPATDVKPETTPEVKPELTPEAKAEPVVEKKVETVPESKEEPAPEAKEESASEGDPISFRCPQCEQEIEAPRECIDQEAECPMCGCIVFVPPKSEPGTMYGGPASDGTAKSTNEVVTAKAAESMDPALLKNCTIRIDASVLSGLTTEPPKPEPEGEADGMISFFCPKCRQEIEASLDMIGTTAECPNCGESIEIPAASDTGSVHGDAKDQAQQDEKRAELQKRCTMRIDLGDDF